MQSNGQGRTPTEGRSMPVNLRFAEMVPVATPQTTERQRANDQRASNAPTTNDAPVTDAPAILEPSPSDGWGQAVDTSQNVDALDLQALATLADNVQRARLGLADDDPNAPALATFADRIADRLYDLRVDAVAETDPAVVGYKAIKGGGSAPLPLSDEWLRIGRAYAKRLHAQLVNARLGETRAIDRVVMANGTVATLTDGDTTIEGSGYKLARAMRIHMERDPAFNADGVADYGDNSKVPAGTWLISYTPYKNGKGNPNPASAAGRVRVKRGDNVKVKRASAEPTS